MDLSEAAERYERDGFVVLPGLLDVVMVARARRHLALIQQRWSGRLEATAFTEGLPGRAAVVTAPLEGDHFVTTMVSDERLHGLASALLGSEAEVFACTYLVKEPSGGPAALWHQDGYPWRQHIGSGSAVTLWVALDRADDATGGLLVLPASHHRPAEPLVPAAPEDGPNMFGVKMGQLPVEAPRARWLRMAPGDVSAHHPNLVHSSPTNRSDRVRRALAIRYRSGQKL